MNSRLEAISLTHNDPLERFNEDDKKLIEDRLHVLSSLAYFIGKDYGMKVEVNPDKGWHWDFDKNIVRADPDDLLTKPIEFLRFVMSHEAGHRRISRVKGVIPDKVWQLPAFSFMMNVIEDPRDNNFVADNIPHFRDEMKYAYGPESEDVKFETEMQEEANKKFGKKPRFMQAGFEYMKLWYKVSVGEKPDLSPDLPDDVRDVVLKTYEATKRSWNTYPSLNEADNGVVHQGKQLTGEETITEYARASFQINYKEVWPLFKTLVDKDIEDAKNNGQGNSNKKGNDEKKDGSSDKPSEENQGGENSDGGKKKDDKKGEKGTDKPQQGNNEDGSGGDKKPLTEEEAKKLIQEFAEKLAEHFEGEKAKADAVKQAKQAKFEPVPEQSEPENNETSEGEIIPDNEEQKPFTLDDKEIEKLKQKLEQRGKRETSYEQVLRECAPLIDHLTNELQEIFNKRRHTRWESGYRSGKKIHIGKAIQEEVAQTSPFETGAFMRREQPKEADYAIKLLVDLSNSMTSGGKIQEAFKGTVVLSEVLNALNIKFSVAGFNTKTEQYKDFNKDFSDGERQDFQGMLGEVSSRYSMGTKGGYALSEAYTELQKVDEKEKIIFVITDGQSDDSGLLTRTVSQCLKKGYKIIGLGLGRGTEHVRMYYPNSVANINVQKLAKVLGDKLREAIQTI
jgi:cobalamin biosynthesis protein CobT